MKKPEWACPSGKSLTNKHESFLVNSKVKNLIPELFNNDALIFKNLSSEEVSLKSKQSAREVTVSFEGFPYLGIWSKSPEAPFLCIEPWYGIADLKDSKGNLKEKKGINSIDPGAEFVCEHSIKIK